MRTHIFAHRGANRLAPENTMPAFELAYQLKAEGIETDVQLTKDNIPVLFHDEHVKRTTNGTGYIKNFTFDELRQLDAGSWFSQKYAGTTIISLDAFLQWIKPKSLYLNIELKNNKIDYINMETIVYHRLHHFQLLDRTTFSTFNPASIKRIRALDRDIEDAFLTYRRNRNLVQDARKLGANALHVKYRLLNRSLVGVCHRENMPIRVYTINRPSRMLRCYTFDCDGIFTDLPDLATL